MSRPITLAPLALSVAIACSEDPGPSPLEPPSPPVGLVEVCHTDGNGAAVLPVPEPALATHLGHGDYRTQLVVDPRMAPVSDARFRHITDALNSVRMGRIARGERRTAACRITIQVATGTFQGSLDPPGDSGELFPLVIDVPDVTLRGVDEIVVDDRGRATGNLRESSGSTVLMPDRPMLNQPAFEVLILVLDNPERASRGDGAIIEGLSLNSGNQGTRAEGIGILSVGVRGLVIRGNRFSGRLYSAADLRATRALIERNFVANAGQSCGICLAGPGEFTAIGNRIVNGGLGGLYLAPSVVGLPFSFGSVPPIALGSYVSTDFAGVTATIVNNDVEGHVRKPIGFALRILAVGPGTPNVTQSTQAVVRGNDFVGNTFAVVFDAGFPVANTTLRGDLDITMRDNVLTPSCQNEALVAFTRHTGALGTTTNPYLRNSLIHLDLGDLMWDQVWFSHPAGFGNTLVVNGATIVNGSVTAYDPARGCSP